MRKFFIHTFLVFTVLASGILEASEARFQLVPQLPINATVTSKHPTKPVLAVGDAGGRVFLLDIATGLIFRAWDSGRLNVANIHFTPDGNQVLTSSFRGGFSLWDARTGVAVWSFDVDKVYQQVQFLESGKVFIAATGYHGEYDLIDLATGKILKTATFIKKGTPEYLPQTTTRLGKNRFLMANEFVGTLFEAEDSGFKTITQYRWELGGKPLLKDKNISDQVSWAVAGNGNRFAIYYQKFEPLKKTFGRLYYYDLARNQYVGFLDTKVSAQVGKSDFFLNADGTKFLIGNALVSSNGAILKEFDSKMLVDLSAEVLLENAEVAAELADFPVSTGRRGYRQRLFMTPDSMEEYRVIDGGRKVAYRTGGQLTVFDLFSGKIVYSLGKREKGQTLAWGSLDSGARLLVSMKDRTLIVSSGTGQILERYPYGLGTDGSAVFRSQDKGEIIVGNETSLDLKTGKLSTFKYSIKSDDKTKYLGGINQLVVIGSERRWGQDRIAYVRGAKRLYIGGADSADASSEIWYARLNPDRTEAWVAGKDGITVFDVYGMKRGGDFVLGAVLKKYPALIKDSHPFRGHNLVVWGAKAIACSRVDAPFFAEATFGTLIIRDTKTGKEVRRFQMENEVTDLEWTPDQKNLTFLMQGVFHCLSVETGKMYSMLRSGEEWVYYTAEGYWDGSRRGGRMVAMGKGIDAYSVDQFAAYNNRPDLVMRAVGAPRNAEIEHFTSEWQRRIRRMKLSENQVLENLKPPSVSDLKLRADGLSLALTFQARAGSHPVKAYQVYLNDVPLFGSEGKPCGEGNMKETVQLLPGTNRVEVGAVDTAGVESFRVQNIAVGKGDQKGTLYFAGFGVSRYSDTSLNLQYADKDAREWMGTLKAASAGVYSKFEGDLFENEAASPAAFDAVRKKAAQLKPEDTLVLFVAGHGVHDVDAESTYYFLTSVADRNKLAETCVRFEQFEEILSGTPARKKIFFMDTCESGELEPGEVQNLFASAEAGGLRARTARGLTVTPSGSAKPPRNWLLDRNRFIYNDLLRRTGAVVFSSSRGGELSYEDARIENGYFTEALMAAFRTPAADENRDGAVSLEELKRFVTGNVSAATGDRQHPTVDRDNLSLEFSLPLIK